MFDNKAFKALLQQKSIRQAQLARMTGIPRNSINSWLQGVHQPTPARIKLLADTLGVPVDSLIVKEVSDTIESEPKRKPKLCFCPNCGVDLKGIAG